MLAFKFQLTPAQVDFLLVIYGGNYRKIDKSESLLPVFESPWFVPIASKLMAHGLLTHDPDRNPTYVITEKGIAIAKMIVDDAKRIASVTHQPMVGKARKLARAT